MVKHTKQLFAVLLMISMLAACSEREDVTDISPKESLAESVSSSSAPEISADEKTLTQITETSVPESSLPDEDDPSEASDDSEDDKEDFFTQRDEPPALLSSPGDIGLYDVDGNGTNYVFTYDGVDFSVVYTPDHWNITDSYLIDNKQDMELICQALSDEHPIHGSDMESYRTPEDMAYEWVQHNTAYKILDDENPWKQNARDVDLDPYDQGKSIYEIYKDRTSDQSQQIQ